MKKLALYYFDECPYCQLVLNAISELGLKSQIELKNTRHEPSNREKLMRDTGRSQVPCLYIDEVPMFESREIVQWLKIYAKGL